jgi:hypothetical protein
MAAPVSIYAWKADAGRDQGGKAVISSNVKVAAAEASLDVLTAATAALDREVVIPLAIVRVTERHPGHH